MTSQADRRVLEAIDARRERIVGFLQRLIQLDSVRGKEGEVQRFIADTLTTMGLTVDQFPPDVESLRGHPAFQLPDLPFSGRPNVVGVLRGTGGGRSLVLNGHVDTVVTEPADQWKDGPFSGAVREGNIYGRGSSDMKAGLAAMTMAAGTLLELGLTPQGDVFLEYVVDEERSGLGTLACVARGYKADAGICCETSDLEVMPACIGRLWFTIRVRGKPAGIAARWESISAIELGIKIVRAVDELEQVRIQTLTHPLFPDNRGALPCAVTMFNAGSFPSATPEEALLRGSMGLMPYEDLEGARAQLVEHIRKVATEDPWMRQHPPEVAFDGMAAAGAEIPVDHPIVRTVQEAFGQVLGRPPVLSGRKGAADTRFLIRYGSTPTVIFGPGSTAQMHAMNEYVPVDNVIVATKVLALAILHWCFR
ncbi:MAG: ArgE/DapE family deacylase [Bacillati bacterium ANGP1]|uniref:ArgE/DapE family deacylase n=1 Tax=Candidatus Segetimicrobium genomatis TaxID=2569760 RepID=A0A537J732_9BACT|nr:MAG: ArgE/DapE family deacylase [Terrabacteria group bacterium ANGP1]